MKSKCKAMKLMGVKILWGKTKIPDGESIENKKASLIHVWIDICENDQIQPQVCALILWSTRSYSASLGASCSSNSSTAFYSFSRNPHLQIYV